MVRRPQGVTGSDTHFPDTRVCRLVGEAGDGEVALDPAAAIEDLGVGDPANGAVDVVVAQPLEELGRSGAADLDLGEARLVEQGGGVAGGPRLGTNGDRKRTRLNSSH